MQCLLGNFLEEEDGDNEEDNVAREQVQDAKDGRHDGTDEGNHVGTAITTMGNE